MPSLPTVAAWQASRDKLDGEVVAVSSVRTLPYTESQLLARFVDDVQALVRQYGAGTLSDGVNITGKSPQAPEAVPPEHGPGETVEGTDNALGRDNMAAPPALAPKRTREESD
jgi:hypothetical protein